MNDYPETYFLNKNEVATAKTLLTKCCFFLSGQYTKIGWNFHLFLTAVPAFSTIYVDVHYTQLISMDVISS